MSTTKSKDSIQQPILFGDKRPDVIGMDQLYDPDLHGPDYIQSGKIIPAVNSLVVDDQDILYKVVSVNDVYKSTLRPVRFLQLDGDSGDSTTITSIVNYGHERFMLYFDDRVRPISLEIDSKLYVFGTSNIEYRLVRTNPQNKEEEIVSLYLDSDEKFKGNRIPLTDIKLANTTIKWCTNCHTLFDIKEGEVITLQIFNANGQQTAEYHLYAKRSVILDDLVSDGNPIIVFDADGTQMVNDEFYLYENQSPTALNISPFITYADGRKSIVPIDNVSCFMYGFEKDNIPSYPGRKFKILLKKFLSNREITTIEDFDKTRRMITCEKWINIVKNETEYSLKLSIVPWYDKTAKLYRFKFFAYTEAKDHIYDVTEYVTINKEFDPMEYNKEQYLKAVFDSDHIFNNSVTTLYQQSWWITLRAPGNVESYILKDSKNSEYAYGVESSTVRRPVIHYDGDLQQYFVPTSIFKNEEAFLEAFYRFANPPFDTNIEVKPVEPTHFTIRAVDDANVLIATPIPVEEYNQAWNIVRNGPKGQLVGGTVLVEFLKLIGSEYRILYGVPVQVYNSTTGYNRPGNNITNLL